MHKVISDSILILRRGGSLQCIRQQRRPSQQRIVPKDCDRMQYDIIVRPMHDEMELQWGCVCVLAAAVRASPQLCGPSSS